MMLWDVAVPVVPLLSQRSPLHRSIQNRYLLARSSLNLGMSYLKDYHTYATRTIDFTLKALAANFAHKLCNSVFSIKFDRH